MNTPAVTVIVPYYNTAPFLERCAVSLFGQTLDEMQFIFVDDGSTDGSTELLKQVLDRFPNRQAQTTFLRTEGNKSIPTARKEGLALAKGTFVAQCDSDDYVEPEMYNTLYHEALETEADMVICDFCQEGDGGRRYRRQSPSANGDYVRDFLYGRLMPYVWCGITRTELNRQITYPTANYLEDWVQMVQLLHQCRKLTAVHKPLYHYCFHKTSVSHNTSEFNCMRQLRECMENYTLMHDYVTQHCPVDEKLFTCKKVLVRGKLLPVLERWGSSRWRKLYLSTFREVNRIILFNSSLPRERKTEYLAVVMGMYPLMAWLRRGFRRLSPVQD